MEKLGRYSFTVRTHFYHLTLVIALIAVAVSFVVPREVIAQEECSTVKECAVEMVKIANDLKAENAYLRKRIKQIQDEVNTNKNELNSAHTPINGISLRSADAGHSAAFACGQEAKTSPTDLLVMHGSRDGTSCGVHNLNYLKRLSISIPARQ